MKTKIIGFALGLGCLFLVGCGGMNSSSGSPGAPTGGSSPANYNPSVEPAPTSTPEVMPSKPFNYNDNLSPSEESYLARCKKTGEC
ncbi:MAG: hypothetical protein EPN84_04325 [Legionella sp.]|nr:MAG: hypothetical protein EPN84_04325 [Legionella sp.]